MEEGILYKVLWVDDDESIVDGYRVKAETHYKIALDHAPDWEKAEKMLHEHFREYSAIILDANCKLKRADSTPSHLFLGEVSQKLSRFFGEKQETIPWYVLSAGTMQKFDTVLELTNTEERQKMEEVWGKLIYKKEGVGDDSPDALFQQILQAAENKNINKVLDRHKDVFKYLGEGEIISFPEARKTMLNVLSALYHPEENRDFKYEGNSLRKVLECVFWTALNYGIIPKECQPDKCISPQLASLFMSGKDIKVNDIPHVRYGKPEEKPSIFPPEFSSASHYIINYSNKGSHTSNMDSESITPAEKELFFANALLLCSIITWFGGYVKEHPDKEENKAKHYYYKNESKQLHCSPKIIDIKQKNIPAMESLIGTTGFVTNADYCGVVKGVCKVPLALKEYQLKTIRILELKENTDTDAEQYPYLAIQLELVE